MLAALYLIININRDILD